MEWRRYLKLAGLMLAMPVLAWEAPGHAQPVKVVQTGSQEGALERKKTALQRRQEAKKRLLESIEARKANRLSGADAMGPDRIVQGVRK